MALILSGPLLGVATIQCKMRMIPSITEISVGGKKLHCCVSNSTPFKKLGYLSQPSRKWFVSYV